MSIICYYQDQEFEIPNASQIIENSNVLKLIQEDHNENEPIPQFVNPIVFDQIFDFFDIFSLELIEEMNKKIECRNTVFYSRKLSACNRNSDRYEHFGNRRQLNYLKSLLKDEGIFTLIKYLSEIDLEIIHNFICYFLCLNIIATSNQNELQHLESFLLQLDYATVNKMFDYLPAYIQELSHRTLIMLYTKLIKNNTNFYSLILTIIYFKSSKIKLSGDVLLNNVFEHFNHFTGVFSDHEPENYSSLKYLKNLYNLELMSFKSYSTDVDNLPVINSLRSLKLRNEMVSTTRILNHFLQYPNLSKLELCPIGGNNRDDNVYEMLPQFTNIEELCINLEILVHYNYFYIMEFISQMQQLKKLEIICRFAEENPERSPNIDFSRISYMQNLEYLDISHIYMNDISFITHLPNLKYLKFHKFYGGSLDALSNFTKTSETENVYTIN